MLVAMVDVSLERMMTAHPRAWHKPGKIICRGSRVQPVWKAVHEGTCAYVHPVRGMGDTAASGRLLAPGATCDGDFPIAWQSVSGPSSTGYSGASATDFHRLPLPALDCNEP